MIQAEAVADLIDAVTPLQARAAFDQLEGTLTTRDRARSKATLFDLMARLEASLDFPDEGYHFVDARCRDRRAAAIAERVDALLAQAARGRLIREGAQIAIVGTPNVGKSSLFNALLNANRAIVTPIPGTTRDLLTERADIRGLPVALIDTAGIRESADVVEQEGVARARQAAAVADLTLVVLDRSRPLDANDRALIDDTATRPRAGRRQQDRSAGGVGRRSRCDAERDRGVGEDRRRASPRLIDAPGRASLGASAETRDAPLVTNVRHVVAARTARHGDRARAPGACRSSQSTSEEFVLADLQDAAVRLQEITGRARRTICSAHLRAVLHREVAPVLRC